MQRRESCGALAAQTFRNMSALTVPSWNQIVTWLRTGFRDIAADLAIMVKLDCGSGRWQE
jgi:hypothetical protein